MSVNGKFENITEADLLEEADRFAIGTAPRVIDEVRAAIRRWPHFATRAGVSEREVRRINGELRLLDKQRAA